VPCTVDPNTRGFAARWRLTASRTASRLRLRATDGLIVNFLVAAARYCLEYCFGNRNSFFGHNAANRRPARIDLLSRVIPAKVPSALPPA
jgi:hypothetical protein